MGDLEIDQDLDFQRRNWAVERIVWVVLALLLFAAFLGLSGKGPLSAATAGGPGDAVRIEYERFVRRQSPQRLRVHLSGEATRTGHASLEVAREYFEALAVRSISPAPLRQQLGADGVVYVFEARRPGEAVAVTFHLQALQVGWQSGRIGLAGGPGQRVRQLVYP